jgi:hypothetical protein
LKIRPPLQEVVGTGWTQGWTAFFTQLFSAVGWVQSWSFKFDLNFPSVSANTQSAGQSVAVPGARVGDAVTITPFSDTTGILYKGVVSSDDTVTIYAINFTAGAIDPVAMLFRVVVIQN